MTIHRHAHLRHLRQPSFARMFLESRITPEESAGHGGRDDQRVEQHAAYSSGSGRRDADE